MGSRGSISLIIPVYNGEAVIQATVETLAAHFAPRRPFELLMVNDGSTDRTGIVLAQCARRHSELRLIEWPRNRGKGAAVREGLLQARGELIGFCDADLPIAVAGLETMFQMLEAGYDVAIASRVLQGSSVQSPPDPIRWLASRAFGLIVQRAFGLPFQDTQCGLKGFRRQAARSIGQRLCIDGFAFDVELLLVARQLGYRVGEFPVRVATVVLSTINVPAHTGPIARDLWRISRRLRRGHLRLDPLTRQRLSVVVLTKNEERRIARCLESVRWADELIVVDGMSEDRTVEICRQFGARVIPHPFEGSFAQERNLGMEHATGEWVLQIDADDVVTPEFRTALQRALSSPPPHVAFTFRRKSYLLGRFMRYGGWHHYLPNLVRRDAVRYEGVVHERPVVRGTIGRLDADIEHHPCEDLAAFLARHNRYTALSVQELASRFGRPAEAWLRAQLIRRPWKTFWKSYVKKRGFREGMHGLVFSIFYAGVELIKWAKYWELTVGATEAESERVRHQRASACAVGTSQTREARRQTLSVVLMTKNEQIRLASCLECVAGWADEIVIIDDLSTDRTVEVARRYTDKVFSFASEDNHNRQWNRGIERSTGDWILHIDADELVTPELRAAIDRVLLDAQGHNAFQVMRENFYLGHPMRHGGWHHPHLVLFRRDRARCQGAGIHTQLVVDGSIGFLDVDIEHYPFTSIAQFIARQNDYTTVEARLLAEKIGRVPIRTVAYQVSLRPVKLFWKSYVKKHAYRDGCHGLVFAMLWAFVHMMLWAKYWGRTSMRSEEASSVDRPLVGIRLTERARCI